jgi:hypothetical protein
MKGPNNPAPNAAMTVIRASRVYFNFLAAPENPPDVKTNGYLDHKPLVHSTECMPEDLRSVAGLAFKSKFRRKWEDWRKIAKSHSSELFRKASAISTGIQEAIPRV